MTPSTTIMEKCSEWNQWDLHVHTPSSIIQNYGGDNDKTWERFITDLEALPEQFKVIGINDYLFIDGYEKVLSYKKNGRLKNIDLILPVLEYRLDALSGVDFDKSVRPNLHVIFSNEVPIEKIKSQFMQTLDAKFILENDKKPFHQTITKDSVCDLGSSIIKSAPENKKSQYGSPMVEGFNNLNLSLVSIQKSLNKDCFAGKYLLAIGKTEWSSIKWSDSNIATKKNINKQQ